MLLEKFRELSYGTKKNLVSGWMGRKVEAFFMSDLREGDLVRIQDKFGDIFLLEVIDPQKRLAYLRQFPPAGKMEHWKYRINWGICEMSNDIEEGEYSRFFNDSKMHRIHKIRSIRILKEHGTRVPDSY
ncbi:MAG: hypothetical protein AAB522_00475 [Patescibacteria group bacterium]